MKKTLALLLCIPIVLTAQDTLTRIDGKKVGIILKEIRPFDVVYTKAGWPATKTTAVSKSIIANILHADGTTDTFFVLANNRISNASPMLRVDSMAEYGKRDAKIYYKRYNGAATGTFLATFPGSPLFGLITATATSTVKPKWKNMQFPNEALATNEEYKQAYRRKAWTMKANSVWGNWAAGVGVTAATFLLMGLLMGGNK